MSTALKESIYSVGQEEYVKSFDCEIAFVQIISIEDIDSKTAIVQLYHDLIYDRSEKFNISQEIKSFIKDRLCQILAEIFSQLEINNLNLTQKQCYYCNFKLDKTNVLKFELYAIIGQVDGAGLAAIYLFLDNAKKDEGVRTEILTKFLFNLKKLGLQFVKYFLTDKDWLQINATKAVWNNCKV
ncbi:unnamed protein product [Rhizophagus irregularis]|uniref:Uncharacterized protein n=1 Tax=Rhizophagus irregularis TaxID=588596 RepID=A0A915ZAS0_9GLOM|nr:unnamed protein product [Rhizophagus irregularis]